MQEVIAVLVLAVVVEKTLGLVKDLTRRKPSPRLMRLASLFLAMALTVVTRVGILGYCRMLPPDANAGHFVLDWLVTGVLIARGSNAVHDVLALLEKGAHALPNTDSRT
ncbi:MAG TPA: hypothetical protein PKM88_07780 [bacterium]|nr:hypothetical protein [bacterium]